MRGSHRCLGQYSTRPFLFICIETPTDLQHIPLHARHIGGIIHMEQTFFGRRGKSRTDKKKVHSTQKQNQKCSQVERNQVIIANATGAFFRNIIWVLSISMTRDITFIYLIHFFFLFPKPFGKWPWLFQYDGPHLKTCPYTYWNLSMVMWRGWVFLSSDSAIQLFMWHKWDASQEGGIDSDFKSLKIITVWTRKRTVCPRYSLRLSYLYCIVPVCRYYRWASMVSKSGLFSSNMLS